MSKTIMVSNAAELSTALASARSGDTILLNAGDYGKLNMPAKVPFGQGFDAAVTIRAADPGNPPVFSGLNVSGAANLTFRDVTFDYTFAEGDPNFIRPFAVSNSTNLTFESCTFDGDVARSVSTIADGFGIGYGLSITGSTGFRIVDSEISGFHRGLVINGSTDVEVVNNDIHSLRSDGMNFAEVENVLIEGNHIHDFKRSLDSADHPDMIQFWTNGTTSPSTDIVIRGNILDIGAGDATQSIFMRNDMVDRGLAGPEMFYRNILIENNVIVNGHAHGISVGETNGLVIRGNSVLHADGSKVDGADSAVEIPRISVNGSSTDVTITHNATSAIAGHIDQAGWTVKSNAFVQDQNPLAPGWYGDVFIASSLNSATGAHNFIALPGGMLDRLDAGAPATLAPGAGPLFHIMGPQFSSHVMTFDATIMGPQPSGTAYLWDFGDGTTATGAKVTHAYADGGSHDVTLTLRNLDGKTDSTTLPLSVTDAEILRLDASGAFAVHIGGTETLLAPIAGADGLQLGATGVTASVARTHVSPLLGAIDATISLTLEADSAGAAGEVFRLHESFILSVNSAGEMVLQAWSSEGKSITLSTKGAGVNDTAVHDISIRLDDGRLALWVDGELATDAAFGGGFANKGTQDLTFGNPWGKTNFLGDLTAFTVRLEGDGANLPPTANIPVELISEPAQPPVKVPVLDADFNVSVSPDGGQTRSFDAGSTLGPQPDGTAYLWSFGDGSAATGKTVTHNYASGGDYDVTLTVRQPDGQHDSHTLKVGVAGIDLVRLTDSGAFAIYQAGAETLLAKVDAASVEGLQLGGTGVAASVARNHLAPLFFTDDVTIAFTLDAGKAGTTGEIMRLHQSILLETNAKGEPHDVEIRLDAGRLQLWVDGGMAADTAFNGTFANTGSHDLVFGNPWGKTNMLADLAEFEVLLDDGPGSQAFAHDPFSAHHMMDLSGPLL